jgi:hypothetical protein
MADDDLAARVRDALAAEPSIREKAEPPVREKAMFGWRCFMVDDRITVGANARGDLLVRCDPARTDELLSRPSASGAAMKDKPMGPGWIAVGADGLTGDDDLTFWLGVALEHRRRT